MSDQQDDPKHLRKDFKTIGSALDNLTGSLFAGIETRASPELKPNVPAKPAPKERTPNAKLAVAAEQIIASPPDKNLGEVVYSMRELVQCNFPIRDPGPVPSWRRQNGNLTLIIQPGIDARTGESLGVPRGEWPRLIMRFFQKQVVTTQRQSIKLGTTSNDFIRATGGNPNTGRGKRGDARRIETEFRRLIYSRISFVYKEGTAQKGREAFVNMEVAKAGQMWWDFKHPDQTSFFASEIILGDVLYQAFLNDPIPCDFRVLLALKRSLKQASFAMDIYDWQQGHLYRMRDNRQSDMKIKWKYLPDQFGAEFTRLRDWKASFEENFQHVEQLSPALKHEFDGDYLILRDTGTRSGVLPPSRRKMERLANQISPQMREWFQKEFPLHANDFREVEDAFNTWREKESIASRDPDKHFESFVRYNWFKQPKRLR